MKYQCDPASCKRARAFVPASGTSLLRVEHYGPLDNCQHFTSATAESAQAGLRWTKLCCLAELFVCLGNCSPPTDPDPLSLHLLADSQYWGKGSLRVDGSQSADQKNLELQRHFDSLVQLTDQIWDGTENEDTCITLIRAALTVCPTCYLSQPGVLDVAEVDQSQSNSNILRCLQVAYCTEMSKQTSLPCVHGVWVTLHDALGRDLQAL